ncbi:hypothetical protein ACJZ2D_010586 [Fusarium nematophilum]
MVNWARFYCDVVGTLDATSKAKALLNKVIDAKGSTHYSAASFLLSDILLEEFRGTTQLKKKMTAIPLAHMARKMDAVEFQQWSKGHVYLCYYCTEADLCQECFDKRTERIAGKRDDDDWRVLCP